MNSPSAATHFDRSSVARTLADWFHVAQRDLPWRESQNARDPYRILVSEVMLQQTTVVAATPFYRRFIERFPTVEDLARGEIDEILALWAGLGYYSRARNLHRCAQVVTEKYGGRFPRALDEILSLPGIGRYTAGAISSIAFDAPHPIVDANVARVLARVRLIEGDIKAAKNQTQLWHEATQLVEAAHQMGVAPSQFNPAMMELGALICRPRDPDCARCPIGDWCAAKQCNRQHELPQFAPKTAATQMLDACAFIQMPANAAQSTAEALQNTAGHLGQSIVNHQSSFVNGSGRILLRQRSHEAKIWWRGMWELPRVTRRNGESARAALARLMSEEIGVDATIGEHLATVKHGVTTYKITLDCHAVALQNEPDASRARWFERDELDALAMPSTMRALLRRLLQNDFGARQLALFDTDDAASHFKGE